MKIVRLWAVPQFSHLMFVKFCLPSVLGWHKMRFVEGSLKFLQSLIYNWYMSEYILFQYETLHSNKIVKMFMLANVWNIFITQYCIHIWLFEVYWEKFKWFALEVWNLHCLIIVLIAGSMQNWTNQRSGEDMPGIQLLQSRKSKKFLKGSKAYRPASSHYSMWPFWLCTWSCAVFVPQQFAEIHWNICSEGELLLFLINYS